MTFQYVGRIEGKQFKLYLSLTMFRFLSLRVSASAESAESASLSADFCPKTLFYSFYGRLSPELAVNRGPSPPTSVPKLKILFQISLTEKWYFGAKGLWANHLTFSFSHYFIRSWYSSDLDSFLCPTDYMSWSVGNFDLHSPAVLAISFSVRWIDLLFLLSVAYYVTVSLEALFEVFNWQSSVVRPKSHTMATTDQSSDFYGSGNSYNKRLIKVKHVFTYILPLIRMPHMSYVLSEVDLVLFGFVWFYGKLTILCYLMLNPIYTYILNV